MLAGNEGRALRDEAEERGHGDAAVLDLGVAEPADRGLLADTPVGVACELTGESGAPRHAIEQASRRHV